MNHINNRTKRTFSTHAPPRSPWTSSSPHALEPARLDASLARGDKNWAARNGGPKRREAAPEAGCDAGATSSFLRGAAIASADRGGPEQVAIQRPEPMRAESTREHAAMALTLADLADTFPRHGQFRALPHLPEHSVEEWPGIPLPPLLQRALQARRPVALARRGVSGRRSVSRRRVRPFDRRRRRRIEQPETPRPMRSSGLEGISTR